MSHVTKLVLRIIMVQVRKQIKPEISEEQCDFLSGNAITIAVIEWALEVQKEI